MEEGRFRKLPNSPFGGWGADYFIKDHLGNTRMVLTDEQKTDAYPVASLESASLNNEKNYYAIPDDAATRVLKSNVPGYPNDAYTNPNDYVHKLSGSGTKIGTGIVLKVMSGDKVNIRANSWYRLNSTTPNTPANPLNDLVAALAGGITGVSAGKTTVAQLTQPSVLPSTLNDALSFVSNDYANHTDKPKAYLNFILFDEQFKPVITNDGRNTGIEQVGADNEFKTHNITGREITRNGYLYVYVSNETPNINVFFDNLQVTHTRGSIIEENHYYAYGLKIAGISSKKMGDIAEGSLKNNYQYQGDYSEFDEDINWNDFELRNYDLQIGRFVQQDPYDQYPSPYIGMGNDPINNVDPSGGLGINFGTIGQITGSVLADRALITLAGAAVGFGVDKLTGGNGWTGAAIGGAVGLGATFIPPFDIGAIGGALKDAVPSLANLAINVYKQVAPQISRTSGGFTSIELDVTFKATNVDADGLQIIQTFQGTRRDDGVQVGTMVINEGGVNYDAFVDGGKNSPYVTEGGNPPAHPTKPYYLEPGEVKSQVSFDKSKKSGSIRMYDRPGAVYQHKIAKFETIIVATNYKGTGKDYVLGAFKWGWKNNGKTALHSGVTLNKTMSATARKIIAHDYPSYKF